MIAELMEEDALLVMAKGLGMFELFADYLSIYSHSKSLVLVVGSTKDMQARLDLDLRARGCEIPPRSINNEYTAEERLEVRLYR